MSQSRTAKIKDIEDAEQDAQGFLQAAQDARKKLENVEDPKIRQELIEAVNELESARNS